MGSEVQGVSQDPVSRSILQWLHPQTPVTVSGAQWHWLCRVLERKFPGPEELLSKYSINFIFFFLKVFFI